MFFEQQNLHDSFYPEIFVATLSQSPLPGSDDETSDWEIDSTECKARAAESRAKKEREKAGLPEVKLDELPSCCAPKMMNLSFMRNDHIICQKNLVESSPYTDRISQNVLRTF